MFCRVGFFFALWHNAVKDFLLRKTLACHCFGVFRRSSAFAPEGERTPRTACPKTAKQWHVRIAVPFLSRRKILHGVALWRRNELATGMSARNFETPLNGDDEMYCLKTAFPGLQTNRLDSLRSSFRVIASLVAIASIGGLRSAIAEEPAAIDGKSPGKAPAAHAKVHVEAVTIPACMEKLKLSSHQQDQIKVIVSE